MRRLFILLAVFLMIVFNGIAFNVLADSHGHDDGDGHDAVTTKSDKVKTNPDNEKHEKQKSSDEMENH